jgi:hypothetical protein
MGTKNKYGGKLTKEQQSVLMILLEDARLGGKMLSNRKLGKICKINQSYTHRIKDVLVSKGYIYRTDKSKFELLQKKVLLLGKLTSLKKSYKTIVEKTTNLQYVSLNTPPLINNNNDGKFFALHVEDHHIVKSHVRNIVLYRTNLKINIFNEKYALIRYKRHNTLFFGKIKIIYDKIICVDNIKSYTWSTDSVDLIGIVPEAERHKLHEIHEL